MALMHYMSSLRQKCKKRPFCEDYNSRQNEISDVSVPSVGGKKIQTISVVSRAMCKLNMSIKGTPER